MVHSYEIRLYVTVKCMNKITSMCQGHRFTGHSSHRFFSDAPVVRSFAWSWTMCVLIVFKGDSLCEEIQGRLFNLGCLVKTYLSRVIKTWQDNNLPWDLLTLNNIQGHSSTRHTEVFFLVQLCECYLKIDKTLNWVKKVFCLFVCLFLRHTLIKFNPWWQMGDNHEFP